MSSPPLFVLKPRELAACQNLFKDHFRLKDTGPIERTVWTFPWSGLASAVASIDVQTGSLKAVKFHYGLHRTSFCLAIEVMEMKPTDGEGKEFDLLPVPDAFFLYNEEDGKFEGPSAPDWEEEQRCYLENVEVRRKQQPVYTELRNKEEPKPDPTAIIFPWELEIEPLYEQNKEAGIEMGNYLLAVSCISVQDALYDEEEFCHGLALNIRKLTTGRVRMYADMLGELGQQPLFNNGADLGNLCPPRCHKYRLQ